MKTATRVTLIAAALALLPLPARASSPKIDVSQDTIVCRSVSGTVKYLPGLTNGGVSTRLVTIKGSLAGCTVSGPNSAIVLGGTFTAKLGGGPSTCSELLGQSNPSGTVTFKWQADKTTPIEQTSTVVTITGASGTVASLDQCLAGFQMGAYLQSSLVGSHITGAFLGTDGGASSSNTVVVTQEITEILNLCASANGIKQLTFGLGVLALG